MSKSDRRLSQASTLASPEYPSNRKYDLSAIISACEHGDSETVKSIDSTAFAANGDDVRSMFNTAVSHHQVPIIHLLSSKFPAHRFGYHAEATAFHDRDAATLRAMLTHEPSVANYEENYRTKLRDFCEGSDPSLALLLLEFGADPCVHPPGVFFQNPLSAAVREQPMVLIKRLIECGDQVTDFAVTVAQNNGRDDVVAYLERVRLGGEGKKGSRGRCSVL